MKYRTFSAYWVFDEIKAGKTVCVLDRKLREVFFVNSMTVDRMIAVLNSAEENSDRYEFWTEEEEENKNVEEL